MIVGSDMTAHTKFELELRNFVKQKKIQDHVHFVNKTLAVAPYLAAIDVLVQNSQVLTIFVCRCILLFHTKLCLLAADNFNIELVCSLLQVFGSCTQNVPKSHLQTNYVHLVHSSCTTCT